MLTFASGPTNSMRGAAFLTGVADAMVIDIGGTTADVGALVKGFPRPASLAVEVGGVRTNFRMPDVYSFGLGGGSIVTAEPLRIGPQSVGYELTSKALAFGGTVLTASDIGLAARLAAFGATDLLHGLDSTFIQRCVDAIGQMIADSVDRMKMSAAPVPLIAVGGGVSWFRTPWRGLAGHARRTIKWRTPWGRLSPRLAVRWTTPSRSGRVRGMRPWPRPRRWRSNAPLRLGRIQTRCR